MCSISGIVGLAKQDRSENFGAAVARMNAALRHRGPDDQGIAEVMCVGSTLHHADGPGLCSPNSYLYLGNTRLAIIDTSAAGHQPLQDPDTGSWITYNGETYNFRELRSEIGSEFGEWHSNSDTEVVLRAYLKWGVQAFAKLRGMFALAIWDQLKGRLVLARDSFGVKPLYYFFGSDRPEDMRSSQCTAETDKVTQPIPTDRFVFASEVRALLASELIPRELSSPAVASFLEYGSVQAPFTILKNVWSLMPGTSLIISGPLRGKLSISVSCFTSQPSNGRQPYDRSQAEAKVELRGILEDSVKAHLVSDVPVGVFLSGGMDSSALVGLMSRVSSDRPKTFSVVFDEAEFNEAQYSRAVAQKFRTDHNEISLSENSLLNTLPDAVAALDQPTMDGINTFIVSKAVKGAGVKVALSGLGGDELFGGYPSFRRAIRLNTLNGPTRRALRSFAWARSRLPVSSNRESKLLQLASSAAGPHDIYRISRQLFSPKAIEEMSQTPSRSADDLNPKTNNGHSDIVNVISQLELSGYMANTLLRDTDSMSMAHSLEVRVPFVDKKVADFVLSLPGDWKIDKRSAQLSKPLLAGVLDDLFPIGFLTRPKMGFTLPFEKWLRLELQSEISSVLTNESLLAAAGIIPEPVANMWSQFLKRPKAVGWSRPWAVYVLTKWCEINRISANRYIVDP